MLESRGVTRKVEITCIVIALGIWVAGLVFGYQTMLAPRSRTAPPNQQLPTSFHFQSYPDDAYDEGYGYDAVQDNDRQARAIAPAPVQP